MVRVGVLGELTVEVDGRSVMPPASWRARSLLAWLALHPGEHPRHAVASRFWPEILDASARASLRNALWSLRRSLGPAGEACLVATRERVGLTDAWVDARELRALSAAGGVDEALALVRGELLAGLDEDWILEARDEYRETVAELLARAADEAESAGRLDRALARTREWSALVPHSEPAHRALLRRLAAAGDRAGALAAHRRFAERLRADIGIAPSAETRALVATLRAGGADASPAAEPRPAATARPLPPRLAADPGGPFVGRDEEIERVREWWEAAKERDGLRVGLLAGDAGIGKSRLAREVALKAGAAGAAVLFGAAHADTLIPYEPFVEALRERLRSPLALPEGAPELALLVPELTGRVGTPATPPQQWRLFEAVAEMLEAAAAEAPLLLVLDDLHHADRSTARLLAHLLRSPALRGLALVTGRLDELAPDAPLADALAAARRERKLDELHLDGLSPGEVAELLAAHAPGADAGPLHARSEGNPLFVLELLHAEPAAGLPQGVRDVVGRRLVALGDGCRRALAAAAVLGREFDLDVLERLAGLDREEAFLGALDEAIDARLLTEVPGPRERCAFTHALLREAVLEGMTGPRRHRLHAAAADALEALRLDDAEAILRHLCDAGPATDAARLHAQALRAGERAAAQLAFDEEVLCYSRALAALPESAQTERRGLTLRRALAVQRRYHQVLDPPA